MLKQKIYEAEAQFLFSGGSTSQQCKLVQMLPQMPPCWINMDKLA
jgi:hypothetical protein